MEIENFIVHGVDAEGNHTATGEGAPFAIFCPPLGKWLPGEYPDRRSAEFVQRAYHRNLTYYADPELGHLKLYRLDCRNEIWGGKGRVAPVATFASVAEFERFAGKSVTSFNGLI